MRDLPFFTLKGMTLLAIEGAEPGSEEVHIRARDAAGKEREFRVFHYQDCCETVGVEFVSGDMLPIGGTIRTADDDHPDEDPDPGRDWYHGESHTWTRYVLVTENGRFEFWFLGTSNGYYGETTDFEEVEK